jgi:hypothetical protein
MRAAFCSYANPVFDAGIDSPVRPTASVAGSPAAAAVTEADVDAALREVRLALLEADVNFRVVKDFVARVRERAVGAEVLATLESLNRRPAGDQDRARGADRRSSAPVTGHSG